MSVNADGEVLLARVTGSCGVKAADYAALAAIRTARFAASPKTKAVVNQEFNANLLVRSTVVIRWHATAAITLP